MELLETIGGLTAFLCLGLWLIKQMEQINAEIQHKEDD